MGKIIVKKEDEAKFIEICKRFLKKVLPYVLEPSVETFGSKTFENELVRSSGEEKGAYPVRVNLEDCNAPITGVVFYIIYRNGSCLVAVSNEIYGEVPYIEYNMFFPTYKEFTESLADEDYTSKIEEMLIAQLDKEESRKILFDN
ncbi:MAG: hypothetical protein IKH58_07340 [Bacteroidales bacterium]|nr:hypothetical protein [Bacteroidales bacterium]